MHTGIHKKSLYYSLRENKNKVRKTTKWLVLFSLLMSITSLVSAFTFLKNEFIYVIAFFSSCSIYLCYTIFTLWQKNKKIKEKLKTL